MPTYTANTDLLRGLAGEFTIASRRGVIVTEDAAEAMALSELGSDVVSRCDELADHLRRASLVIAQQADLIDGLEIDIDAFADELDVDPDELRLQLQLLTEAGLEADAGIIPLVEWIGATTAPQSLRDVFAGLPPTGEDPELDALLLRLDRWLLPLLNRADGEWDARDVELDDDQAADLAALGELLGAGTVMITVEERRYSSGDYHTVETRVSLLEAGGADLLDFVRTAYTDDLALTRLAQAPTLEEILVVIAGRNSAEVQRLLEEYAGGDSDQQRLRDAARRRLREEYGIDIAALTEEFADLGWLGAVLAGHALPPADDASRDQLVAFAAAVGLAEPDDSFATALGNLRDQRLVQEVLVHSDPSRGALIFDEAIVAGTVAVGLRTGVLNQAHLVDAQRTAAALLGVSPDLIGRTLADLPEEAVQVDPEHFVQALALRIPVEALSENQLLSALAYVGAATSLGDQAQRIADVILALSTSSIVGAPILTEQQYQRILGEDGYEYATSRIPGRGRHYKDSGDWKVDYSAVPSHLEEGSDELAWLLDHVGVPGYHKKTFGRRRLHLGVDGAGNLADFQVEKIVKSSWFGTVFKGVFTAIAAITQQYHIVYAMAAHNAIEAYKASGDWLDAVAAGASTVLFAQGAGNLGAYLGAAVPAAQAGATALAPTFATAVTAANLAGGAISAYRAIDQGDIVDGVVAGTRLLATGAELFDFAGAAASTTHLADAIEGVDATVQAVEADDVAGIVTGALGAAAGVVNLGAGSGLLGKGASRVLTSSGETLTDIADATRSVDTTITAIENDDVAGAITGALGTVAAVGGLFGEGSAGAHVLGLDQPAQAAIATIVGAAEGAGAATSIVDAAARGEVLEAVQLLADRVTVSQGGADATVVAHHAAQLSAVIGVAEVLLGVDDTTSIVQLQDQLTPALTTLATALEEAPEDLPLYAGEDALDLSSLTDVLISGFTPQSETIVSGEVIQVVFPNRTVELSRGELERALADLERRRDSLGPSRAAGQLAAGIQRDIDAIEALLAMPEDTGASGSGAGTEDALLERGDVALGDLRISHDGTEVQIRGARVRLPGEAELSAGYGRVDQDSFGLLAEVAHFVLEHEGLGDARLLSAGGQVGVTETDTGRTVGLGAGATIVEFGINPEWSLEPEEGGEVMLGGRWGLGVSLGGIGLTTSDADGDGRIETRFVLPGGLEPGFEESESAVERLVPDHLTDEALSAVP